MESISEQPLLLRVVYLESRAISEADEPFFREKIPRDSLAAVFPRIPMESFLFATHNNKRDNTSTYDNSNKQIKLKALN